jgi:hypothetical protein
MFRKPLTKKAFTFCPIYPEGFAEIGDERDKEVYKVEIDDEETGGKRVVTVEGRHLDWWFMDDHERKRAESRRSGKKKKLQVNRNQQVEVQVKAKGAEREEQGVLIPPFRFKRNSELIKAEDYDVMITTKGKRQNKVVTKKGKDLQPLGWNLHGPDEVVKVVLTFPRESKHELAPLAGEVGVLLTSVGTKKCENFFPSVFSSSCEYNVELGEKINEPDEEPEELLLRCHGFSLQTGEWGEEKMNLDYIPGGTVWEKEGWVEPKNNHCVIVQMDLSKPPVGEEGWLTEVEESKWKDAAAEKVQEFMNCHLDKFGPYEKENIGHNGSDCFKRTTATGSYFLYWGEAQWCIGESLRTRGASGVFATCADDQAEQRDAPKGDGKFFATCPEGVSKKPPMRWVIKGDPLIKDTTLNHGNVGPIKEMHLTMASSTKVDKAKGKTTVHDLFWAPEELNVRDMGWRFNEGTGIEVGPTNFPFCGKNIACGEAKNDGSFSQLTTTSGVCSATLDPVLDAKESYHKDLVQRVAKNDWIQTTNSRLDPLKRLRHLRAEQDWEDEQKKDEKKIFSMSAKWRDNYKSEKFFADLETPPANIIAKKQYDPSAEGYKGETSYHYPTIGLTHAKLTNHKLGLKQVLLSRRNAHAAQEAANGAARHAMNLRPVRMLIAAQNAARVAMWASARGGKSEIKSKQAEEESRKMAQFKDAREVAMQGAVSECKWVSTCFGDNWTTMKIARTDPDNWAISKHCAPSGTDYGDEKAAFLQDLVPLGPSKKDLDPSGSGTPMQLDEFYTAHPAWPLSSGTFGRIEYDNSAQDKTFHLGEFSCISLRNLRKRVTSGAQQTSDSAADFCDDEDIQVSLNFLTKKMTELVSSDSYTDATFLASSLFNCLELTNPAITEVYVPDPEPQTASYVLDPACSIACAASTWYRTFEYKPPDNSAKLTCDHCRICEECQSERVQSEAAVWTESEETKWFLGGQNYRHQIFNARLMLEKIHSKMSSDRSHSDHLYSYQNGFLFVNEAMLKYTRNKLGGSDDDDLAIIKRKDLVSKERGNVMDELMVGVHMDAQVTSNVGVPFEYEPHHKASSVKTKRRGLVYASACPVNYSTKRLGIDWEHPYPAIEPITWKSLACMVLEASYEAVLLAAVHRMQTIKKPGCSKVVICHLGGKAFGNDQEWVFNAINRAIKRTKQLLHSNKGLLKQLQKNVPLKPGVKVRAKMQDGKYYRGTIRQTHEVVDPQTKKTVCEYDIALDTVLNDEEAVHKSLLQASKSSGFAYGDRVKARATDPTSGSAGDHYYEGTVATTTTRDNLASGTSIDIEYDRVQGEVTDFQDLQHWVQHRGVHSSDCERYQQREGKSSPILTNEEIIFHDRLFKGALCKHLVIVALSLSPSLPLSLSYPPPPPSFSLLYIYVAVDGDPTYDGFTFKLKDPHQVEQDANQVEQGSTPLYRKDEFDEDKYNEDGTRKDIIVTYDDGEGTYRFDGKLELELRYNQDYTFNVSDSSNKKDDGKKLSFSTRAQQEESDRGGGKRVTDSESNGEKVTLKVTRKPSSLCYYCNGVEVGEVLEEAYNKNKEVSVISTTDEGGEEAYARTFKIQKFTEGGKNKLVLKSDPLVYVGTVGRVDDDQRLRLELQSFSLLGKGIKRADIIAPVKLDVHFAVEGSATGKREAYSFFNERFVRADGENCVRFKGCE